MEHPATRLLTLLETLQAAGTGDQTLRGSELAARLGVTDRTVRHYLGLLQEMGVPVERERGRYGGYRLRPGYKLPPLLFSEDEAVALTLGLRFAARHGLTLAAPAVTGALAKVERSLPAALRERVQAIQEGITFGDVAPPFPPPPPGVLAILSAAVRERRRVCLTYQSREAGQVGEAPCERRVDPYGVVCYGGRWYVPAHCHSRGALRVFRLDRAQAAVLTGETFAPAPAGFDALASVQQGLAQTPGVYTVELLLHTDWDTARQHVSPAFALLEPAEGGVLLRCHVQRLGWVAHYVAGLDLPLRVLGPPALRDEMRRLAQHATRLADE